MHLRSSGFFRDSFGNLSGFRNLGFRDSFAILWDSFGIGCEFPQFFRNSLGILSEFFRVSFGNQCGEGWRPAGVGVSVSGTRTWAKSGIAGRSPAASVVDAIFGCTPAVAYYRHIVYVEVWYLSGCRSLAPWCMLKSYCRWLVRGGVEVGCSHRLQAGAGAVSVRRSPVAAVVDATLRFTPVRTYDRHVVYVEVLLSACCICGSVISVGLPFVGPMGHGVC